MQNRSKVVVKLRYSNADEESEAIEFDILKAKFFGRESYPARNIAFQQAIEVRPSLMSEDYYSIKILHPQSIPDYKQVELYNNYRKYLPKKYKDITCPKPPESVLDTIKKERSERVKGKKKKKDEKETSITII
jgi:hypothetical protein